MLRAEKLSPGPIGLGTRFRAKITSMRRPAAMTIEFTGYERPRRLASTTRLSTMDIRGVPAFDPVAGGTRMRWSWDVEPRGLFKLMTPMVAHVGQRQEQIIWVNLKRVVEAQEAPSSAAGR